ncbi:RING-H2 finger protein ATL56 [Raphanus sativus]|uniref:RING-type E3 ubiquitin transferase n=1 Tax=Raphanus sativus TaxID=3726 RepID=A0A6J0JRR6_RAPSA|nr:RING-H2 finger protein ATL56 [Raphanus sativus]KAJ4888999.1 RING-H2 finger protein ATL56 [Raphanus sativus]
MPPTNDNRISGEPPYNSASTPPPKPKTRILSILLVGVIMLSIFFLFLLLIGIASVLLLPFLLSSLHRHLRRRRRNRRHVSSDGLSSRFVKKLPQFKFYEPTTRFGSVCVVCLDGFRQGQWCRNLPGCGHVFHRKCVDTWLVKAATCPVCRARVRLREEDEQQGLLRCFGHRRVVC